MKTVSKSKTTTTTKKAPAPAKAAPVKAAPVSAKPVAPAAPVAKPVVPATSEALEQVGRDVRSIKSVLDSLVARPLPAHKGLEGSVESIRRLLSELIESRMEAIIGDLIFIRGELVTAGGGAKLALDRIDKLLQDLGAIRFEGAILDFVDPLIHKVVEERRSTEHPDGVILATLSPGFRTGRGAIVTKASVAVNRRS